MVTLDYESMEVVIASATKYAQSMYTILFSIVLFVRAIPGHCRFKGRKYELELSLKSVAKNV